MIINSLLVAVGGFFGAITRFIISAFMKRKYAFTFPFATLFVNLVGSFLLGFLYGAGFDDRVGLLLGTGYMGSLTTFSTFKLENSQFIVEKNWRSLVIYLGISYTIGIFFAYLGMKIGSL